MVNTKIGVYVFNSIYLSVNSLGGLKLWTAIWPKSIILATMVIIAGKKNIRSRTYLAGAYFQSMKFATPS